MPEFSFSQEQIDNLNSWKNSLQRQDAKEWAESENEAEIQIHKILVESGFEDGNNLSSDQLDQIFSYMRTFSSNRNLSNLLYNSIGIDQFNENLRYLFYGKDPLFVRVDKFFNLRYIGIQTISQLLLALDSTKYPLITIQTRDALNLSAEQEEKARKDAIEIFGVKNPDNLLHDRSLDFLRDCIIFEEIRRILSLEKYTQINNLIWFGGVEEENAPTDSLKQYVSVSIEYDLRDYLAINPQLIEKGLKLIEKEYDTKEVGCMDLLCEDKDGGKVVVELKKGRESDKVVGQILRYMGWLQTKEKTRDIRGIIIVNEPDQRLSYAVIPIRNIHLKYYKVNFLIADEYKSQ